MSDAQPTAKREAIQAAVLQATEELLAEDQSFADLGVEKIATRAGISRTAFYFYFRDKRELLMRLASDITEQLYHQAESWFRGEGDPDAELRQALELISALYRDHGPLLRAIVEVSTYDEEIATYWRALLGRFVEATRLRIENEQAAGRADASIKAQPTAFALVWMTERTFYQHLVQAPEFSGQDQQDALAGIWMRSVYGRG